MFPIWHTCYNTLFNLGKNEKKRTNKFVWWWGLCKLGKGDRRSHVRLAVSQAGAILTDKSYEKGGDSAAGWLQESPWWQMVDLEFGIPFPLVLQCQCLLLLLSFSRLAKSGYLPPPLLLSQKQQRKLDYIFSYLE